MDFTQYVGVSALPEMGSKSLVSKIMNGKVRLTVDPIHALRVDSGFLSR